MKKALIIEDDRFTAKLIKRHLEFVGITGKVDLDGESGFQAALSSDYDLILLDIVLPHKNGIAICRDLRSREIETPIMMLTSKNSIEDITNGISIGADGYLAKPFSIKELQARSLALIKRPPQSRRSKLRAGMLTLDLENKQLEIMGEIVPLRKREFAILHVLVRNIGNNVSTRRLNSATSDHIITPTLNSIHVHISHIRRKLAKYGLAGSIQTVHGIGYRLKSEG